MARTQVTGKQIADGALGIDLTVDVFGTLPVANGGSGAATFSSGLLVASGTSAFATVAAPSGAVVGTTDAQALTGKTLVGTSNTITKVTGTLPPVQVMANSETMTIASGSVTQIAGTTVNGVSPAIGDRILIATAPAATGAGSAFTLTTQPANGVYVVSANTTNLTVARAPEMSSTGNHPGGLSVYVEGGTWSSLAVYVVINPSSAAAFTYGTGNICFGGSGGVNPVFNSVYASVAATPYSMNNGTGTTVLKATTNAGAQTLTLPATATSDTLVGLASVDTLINKRINPRHNASNAPGATPTLAWDSYDQISLTGVNAAITSMSSGITGTPVAGQKGTIRIKDDGTARAITWGTSYRTIGVTLPTTTVISKTHYIGWIYNATDSKYDVVAVGVEA